MSVLKFAPQHRPDPDEVFSEDGLFGSLAFRPDGNVDLYVRLEESGNISFLYSQTVDEGTSYTLVEMTPGQAHALGRALLGKFA